LSALTVGPDHNLWFTASTPSAGGGTSGSVVQITLAGQFTSFALPSTNNVVSGLTLGPDGNLWFSTSTSTSSGASASIGQITPSGKIAEFGLPATYSNPSALTLGPDGNLWFADQTNSSTLPSGEGPHAIGRVTPAGTIVEFPLSSNISSTSTLTAGPDGNLWFSEPGAEPYSQIGQITPAGTITGFPLAPGRPISFLSGLTVGPDKNLYFTLFTPPSPSFDPNGDIIPGGIPGGIEIGQISTSGNVLEFAGAPDSSFTGKYPIVYVPTVGSDGNLWFPDAGNIGRLDRALATADQAVPPHALASGIMHSKKGGTSIFLDFDEALNPGTAGSAALYHVATGVRKHHMLVYSKTVKISHATYDASFETVTLKLANPPRANRFQVTLHAGIMGVNGTSTTGDTTIYGN
jgi:virginiamycin B lyase